MANTKSTTLSVRLKPEIKKRLAKLAKAFGRGSNFLISDAVESYVADQERMLVEVLSGVSTLLPRPILLVKHDLSALILLRAPAI